MVCAFCALAISSNANDVLLAPALSRHVLLARPRRSWVVTRWAGARFQPPQLAGSRPPLEAVRSVEMESNAQAGAIRYGSTIG